MSTLKQLSDIEKEMDQLVKEGKADSEEYEELSSEWQNLAQELVLSRIMGEE